MAVFFDGKVLCALFYVLKTDFQPNMSPGDPFEKRANLVRGSLIFTSLFSKVAKKVISTFNISSINNARCGMFAHAPKLEDEPNLFKN